MTTIENPTTEKMNGSSRMTTDSTDSPWWIVRPSLAVGLAGSVALTMSAFRVAGLAHPSWAMMQRSLAGMMQLLSATPTLAGISLLACGLMLLRGQRRSSRVLCGLLAAAALAGAWLNVARESHGVTAIERLIDRALAEAQPALAGK